MLKGVLKKTRSISQIHKEKVPCDVCGVLFGSGVPMKTHQRRKHTKTKCTFHGCDREFEGISSMRYHLKNEHENTEVKCQLCDAVFPSQFKLRRHTNRHNKAYCDIDGCNYQTDRRDYLATHYKKHKNISEDQREKLLAELLQARYTSMSGQ
jgi:Zinc finger, C2H2 type/C2H2-type zinc finger